MEVGPLHGEENDGLLLKRKLLYQKDPMGEPRKGQFGALGTHSGDKPVSGLLLPSTGDNII